MEIAGKFYPVIPIELKAKKKQFLTRAYVDSGASFSIFNAEIADYLNLDYRKGNKIYPAGVGGHICAYLNEIFLSIQNIDIRCEVLFSDEFTVKFNLLGRAGIFDRFRICFDDREKKLYMFPKDNLL
ncbi:MAG: pepsin/retropepsin-like aspartic protease family protein [Candidatus Syntropharchaeia archaeon]